MSLKFGHSGFTGCLVSALVAHFWFQIVCHGRSITEGNVGNASHSEIDYETLSLFGVSPEFAEQFRINLIKAIEAAKDEVDPLRQGEFGGVGGGFYQGGGGGGGGGQGGGGAEEEEDDYEDTSMGPGTPGPGAFGVLSGLFGIFSGLGALNPSRIIQSTVNFFPPGQRMQAQMVVDSLIGYTPPENRTSRPRPRTRRPTTLMTITDTMMKEVTETSIMSSAMMNANATVVSKDGESNSMGNFSEAMAPSLNETFVDAMSEVVVAAPEPTTTSSWFVNVHELLEMSTTPPPLQNEDDEKDYEKRFQTTERPKSNSTMAPYKLKVKSPENEIDTRGVAEEDAMMNLNTTSPSPSSTSSSTI